MYSTRIVVDIIECLSHKNNAVRAAADKFTELGKEFRHCISIINFPDL